MKKYKSLCVCLAASMLLCSCKGNTPEETFEDEVEETETTADSIPLTEDILDGIWVDDTGFVCRFDFDNDIFTDSYGAAYYITGISDDSIELSLLTEFTGSYLDDYTYGLPLVNSFTIDASYTDDGTLFILDSDSHRIDSDEGEAYVEDLTERLSGSTLELAVIGMSLVFNEDITELAVNTYYGNSDPVQIGFTGASITYDVDGEGEMIFRTIGDDLLISTDGQIGYGTSSRIDIPGSWLLWDASTDEIQILEYYGKNEDGNMPVLETSEYLSQIDTEYGEFVAMRYLPGVYINNEVYEQYSDTSSSGTTFLIDMRSPLACQMIERDHLHGNDAGQLTEHIIGLPDGFISIEMFGNEWYGDILSFLDYPDAQFTGNSGNWYADVYSHCYNIELRADRYEPTISFEYDGSYEDASIYRIDIYSGTQEELDTVYEDGYATATISDSGIYFLGHVEQPEEMTQDNYFDIDPEDSDWVSSGLAGDIIPLVDMDYIQQSYNGVFVVDSIEDLASLTYFVNTYPRNEEYPECIWVDLTDDIDLTGYNWAPIGTNNFGIDRCFNGIFAGNGHTISGLHIENVDSTNGFFGDIYFATVFGLNIEDAYINGSSSSIMAGNTSTTDYYDCHVSGELPNNFGTGEDLFPFATGYGNNGYLDCSIIATNADGNLYDLEIDGNLPHTGSSNELQDLFDPEHDGTYDYSTDYFFG